MHFFLIELFSIDLLCFTLHYYTYMYILYTCIIGINDIKMDYYYNSIFHYNNYSIECFASIWISFSKFILLFILWNLSIYSIIWWVQLYDENKYIFALWRVHYIIHFGMMTVLAICDWFVLIAWYLHFSWSSYIHPQLVWFRYSKVW